MGLSLTRVLESDIIRVEEEATFLFCRIPMKSSEIFSLKEVLDML